MPDIVQDVPVAAEAETVFECVSTSEGLSRWWSKGGSGIPGSGNLYEFDFGPEYQWKAVVETYEPGRLFKIRMTDSDDDWKDSTVSFEVLPTEDGSNLRFEHRGWPEDNAHYRSSAYCWAMYLRCMKNYIEKGIELPYESRFAGE